MKHYKIKKSILNNNLLSINLYFKDIAKFKTLSIKNEKELFTKLRSGDDKLREKLINSNLRFVISIAKQYQNRGAQLSDLIEAGNIGLIEAVDQYDLSYNVRFASYAAYKIRKHILLEISQHNNIINIPYNKTDILNKINKIKHEFEQHEQREPTIEELSVILELPEYIIKETINNASITIVPETSIGPTGEILNVFDTIDLEDSPKEPVLFDNVQAFLKTALNPMEQIIINKLFGFQEDPKTLDEVGKELNVTSERVRQIKNKAIIKLRKNPDITKFKALIE